MKRLVTLAMGVASLLLATSANAYFVRPFYSQGGSFVDGLIQNGATSGAQNFGSSLQSSVDLDTGTVRSLVDVTGTNMVVQAGGSFGDVLSFDGASGTTVDFGFAYDGIIDVTNVAPAGSLLQFGVSANLFVFEAGSGADYTNFNLIGGELIGESQFLSFIDPATDFNQVVNEMLSGSLVVGAVEDFEIFASMALFTATNLNPVTVQMDFLNTGTFEIGVESGVTYSSESGVFLDSIATNPAPVPATIMLLLLGLLGIRASSARK